MPILITDPKDIALASMRIRVYYRLSQLCREYHYQRNTGRYPLVFRVYREAREEYELLSAKACAEVRAVKENDLAVLDSMVSRYRYAEFLIYTPLPQPYHALAAVANPPDLTLAAEGESPPVKPSTWASVGFFSMKLRMGDKYRKHSPVLGKVVNSSVVAPLALNPRILRDTRLREIYERSYQRSREKGLPGKPARIRAARDVVRATYLAAWLVVVIEWLERGLIGPRNVVLPYELAEASDPVERAKSMVQPSEMVDEARDRWKKYNWPRLLELLGKA